MDQEFKERAIKAVTAKHLQVIIKPDEVFIQFLEWLKEISTAHPSLGYFQDDKNALLSPQAIIPMATRAWCLLLAKALSYIIFPLYAMTPEDKRYELLRLVTSTVLMDLSTIKAATEGTKKTREALDEILKGLTDLSPTNGGVLKMINDILATTGPTDDDEENEEEEDNDGENK